MWFHLHTICFALSNQTADLRCVAYHYQESCFRDSMLEVYTWSNRIAELILNDSVTTWVSAAKVIGTKKPRPTGTEAAAHQSTSHIYISVLYTINQLQSILTHLNPFPNLCLDSLAGSRKWGKQIPRPFKISPSIHSTPWTNYLGLELICRWQS